MPYNLYINGMGSFMSENNTGLLYYAALNRVLFYMTKIARSVNRGTVTV